MSQFNALFWNMYLQKKVYPVSLLIVFGQSFVQFITLKLLYLHLLYFVQVKKLSWQPNCTLLYSSYTDNLLGGSDKRV